MLSTGATFQQIAKVLLVNKIGKSYSIKEKCQQIAHFANAIGPAFPFPDIDDSTVGQFYELLPSHHPYFCCVFGKKNKHAHLKCQS